MPPKKIPLDRETKALAINIQWLDEFRRDRQIRDQTYSLIMGVLQLKEIAGIPFNDFTIEQIDQYISIYKQYGYSDGGIRPAISAIRSFSNYLKEKYPDDFRSDFLSGVTFSEILDDPKRSAKPLDYLQICMLRDFIQNDPRMMYFFELVFQTGVKKQDIKYCIPENADHDKMVFTNKGKVVCSYSNIIQEILDIYGSNYNLSIVYNIPNYLSRISKYLRDEGLLHDEHDITCTDLMQTHDRFFFCCPSCGKSLENTASNWVLVRIEGQEDSDYHLFCKNCRGRIDG